MTLLERQRDVETLGARLMRRLDMLADASDEPGLTRLYLSPAHAHAAEMLLGWMRDIGLEASLDPIGNVVGRYQGVGPAPRTLIIGSHIDTVRDAGRYDGNLGVIAALGCVEELARRRERLPFTIEVIAFGDEEGVRFPTTLNGSRALAGTFDPANLDQRDEQGVSLREALVWFGGDPAKVGTIARRREDVLAFVEVHIEQGPVLQDENLPVGIVTAINGATRLSVELSGTAGHAGTVPMRLRRDPMTAAAHMITAIDQIARRTSGLVATVGKIEARPGAANVIPGSVAFTIDARSPDDAIRTSGVDEISDALRVVAARHQVGLDMTSVYEAKAVVCDAGLGEQFADAIKRHHLRPFRLPSGAGHDAMAVSALCPVGMLFVRCRDGVSHTPAEAVTVEDADIAMRVLVDFVRRFDPARIGGKGRQLR